MSAATMPKDFDARDCALLRHARDYGVVLQAVASKLYFGGKQSGHVIRRMAEAGDLEIFPRALPGNISYARLTKSGCVRIGASEKLAQPLSGHALNHAIATVVYCVLGKFRRLRLTHQEMQSLFGDDAPHANVPHVLVAREELGHFAVLRVVFAGGSIAETKKQLLRLSEEASKNAALADAMAEKPSYGFLCLCPTEAQRKALAEALARTESLHDTLVRVDVGPGVEELPAFLKSLRGKGE